MSGSSALVGTIKEAEQECLELVNSHHVEISKLEAERLHLLAEITELRRAHPISEAFVSAVTREQYVFLEGYFSTKRPWE